MELRKLLLRQKKGRHCIYELPIGYWKSARNIFQEERELNPEWANTLPGLKDSDQKLRRKDEELELADSIVVASKFVETTLKNNCAIKSENLCNSILYAFS